MNDEITAIPAIMKMESILDFLAEQPNSTFTDILQGASVPKATLHRTLKVLVSLGYVRISSDGAYNLGFRLYELGEKAISQLNIKKECLPFLFQLRDRVGLTCHLGVLADRDAIYLAKIEGETRVSVRTWEGLRLTLHSSAVGKALLVTHSKGELLALFPEEQLQVFTDRTVSTRTEFFGQIDQVRTRGWAFDDEERFENLRCIAAPIYGPNGKAVAAVSIVGAAFQIPDAKIDELAAATMEICKEISTAIGFRS